MLKLIVLERKLLCVRALIRDGTMFCFNPRRKTRGKTVFKHCFTGREHLVDFECNEEIHLVIRDYQRSIFTKSQ